MTSFASTTDNTAKIAWVDIETTGLDPASGVIVEVAVVVTDGDLNEMAHFTSVVSTDPSDWDDIPAPAKAMHEDNGLIVESLSASAVSSTDVEARLVKFMGEHFGSELPPMGGSSVQFDRRWLEFHMPEMMQACFHYRNIDVSSVSALAKMWGQDGSLSDVPASDHRALGDIRRSVAILRSLRSAGFIGNTNV